jgi:hypothetical protein
VTVAKDMNDGENGHDDKKQALALNCKLPTGDYTN